MSSMPSRLVSAFPKASSWTPECFVSGFCSRMVDLLRAAAAITRAETTPTRRMKKKKNWRKGLITPSCDLRTSQMHQGIWKHTQKKCLNRWVYSNVTYYQRSIALTRLHEKESAGDVTDLGYADPSIRHYVLPTVIIIFPVPPFYWYYRSQNGGARRWATRHISFTVMTFRWHVIWWNPRYVLCHRFLNSTFKYSNISSAMNDIHLLLYTKKIASSCFQHAQSKAPNFSHYCQFFEIRKARKGSHRTQNVDILIHTRALNLLVKKEYKLKG